MFEDFDFKVIPSGSKVISFNDINLIEMDGEISCSLLLQHAKLLNLGIQAISHIWYIAGM